jgi:hypothetical protein
MLKHFGFAVVTDLKIFCLFRVPVLEGEAGLHAESAFRFTDSRRTIHSVLWFNAQNIAAGASRQSYKERK